MATASGSAAATPARPGHRDRVIGPPLHADGRANFVHAWPVSTTKLFTIAGKAMFYLDVSGQGSISGLQAFNRTNWGATSSAVMYQPGKVLQLAFGVIRTTAADGSSDGPVVVYTAGRTTYTLHEQVSLAVAPAHCTLVGFGPTASVISGRLT